MALSKQRIMNKLWVGGEHNFATSTCFLRFDGELLNPDIYLMKVITEVELCVCLMRENNDHWFSRQARTFELLFTIFNVHKIK